MGQNLSYHSQFQAISLYEAKKYFVSHCYTVLQGWKNGWGKKGKGTKEER